MTRGESSPFMTSSPRKTKLPPPRHPLENRNSAPDIVVTGTTGLTQFRHSSLGNCPTSGPAINPTGSRRQQHPLEDRIHRAKARVQNGLYNLSSTSQSSSASSIYSTNRYLNFELLNNILLKGQLISKCPFGVIVWTKIPTKFFPGFLP